MQQPKRSEQRHAFLAHGVGVADGQAEHDQRPPSGTLDLILAPETIHPPQRPEHRQQIRELRQHRVGPADVLRRQPDEQHDHQCAELMHPTGEQPLQKPHRARQATGQHHLEHRVVESEHPVERGQQQWESPRIRVRAEAVPRRVVDGEPVAVEHGLGCAVGQRLGLMEIEREIVAPVVTRMLIGDGNGKNCDRSDQNRRLPAP